jgi:transporter family-2 protein
VPLRSGYLIAATVPLIWFGLWLTVRGMPLWYASAGFAAGIGLVLTPRLIGDLGLAEYFAALTFGGAAGALAFDHSGAIGTPKRAVTPSRVGGLALVAAGLVLVRVA